MSAASALGGRDLAAGRLRLAAFACLLALAPVMVVAHRSSVLTVTLAAAFAAGAALADGGAGALGRRLAALLRSPLGAAALAFLAYALVSTAWAPRPGASLRAWGELALPVAAALVLAATLPGRLPRGAATLLAGSLLLAAALVAADLWTGQAARRWAGLRAQAFVLNRPALTLLVLLPPVLVLLREARRPGLAGLAALACAGAIGASESGAAKLGLLAGAAGWALARLAPRAAAAVLGAGALLTLALAPAAGSAAELLLPDALVRSLRDAHARDRMDIWAAFGAAVRDAPTFGQGFGAATDLGGAPVAATVAPEYATLLAVGHPHSAPLQAWVELGAVGVGLAAALAALTARALATLRAADAEPACALAAAAVAVSLVGHGAWQGWWPAAIGTACVLLRHGVVDRMGRLDGRA